MSASPEGPPSPEPPGPARLAYAPRPDFILENWEWRAGAQSARATTAVQRMNLTPQPAPKFATRPGSHAGPQGGMGPSHHARFTQEPSFGHWKAFRSSLLEEAIGTPAPSVARSIRAPHRRRITRLSKRGFTRGPRLPRPSRSSLGTPPYPFRRLFRWVKDALFRASCKHRFSAAGLRRGGHPPTPPTSKQTCLPVRVL